MKTQRLQEHGGENKNNLPKPVVGVTKRVKEKLEEKLEFSSQKEKKRHSRTENNKLEKSQCLGDSEKLECDVPQEPRLESSDNNNS